VIGSATPALAAAVTVTLSATTGPSIGGNTLTATATTAFLSGYTAPGTSFTVPACPTTYSTTPVTPTATVGNVQATVVKKLSNTKAAITVPAGVVTVGSAATTKYNVCVYGTMTAGSALIGTATYTVAVAPTITAVTPSSGPAQGGSSITVTGTGFPTTTGSITASIGGTSLLSITPVSATSFTAITPAHAPAANLTLAIGTTAGTLNKTSAFSYTNGIVIGPNTAPNTGTVDIDVQGVGFLALDFTTTTGTTPNDGNAHVYLTNGTYDATGSTTKALGEITECTDVIVIGDTELICTLQLAKSLSSAGLSVIAAHSSTTRTITDGVLLAATSSNLTSATAAFTAADVGVGVTGSGVSNAFIGAYVNATTVTLATTGTGATLTPTATTGNTLVIGGPRTVITGASLTSASATAASTALFVSTDLGRSITGTGIAPNTTISAYGTTSSVTLSTAATATSTGTLTIGQPYPVGIDTYTVTVVDDGGFGATVSQSIVSSGATFTVSPY
jgi:hypothetical protein